MSDEIDMAQDAEEQFRQQAIENARRQAAPNRVCPVCRARTRMEDAWLVCDACGWEKDTRY